MTSLAQWFKELFFPQKRERTSLALLKKHCVPCEGGVPPMTTEETKKLLRQLPGWKLNRQKHLYRQYKFKNFVQAMRFVNAIAKIAERENHHPDMTIQYSKVQVELWTHAINGLSENDFILAAKIEKVTKQFTKRPIS